MNHSALKKWAAVGLTLAVIALVVPFVIFAVPQVIGADESFVVLSGSMEPTLSPGDVVVVDATAPIRENDVITYLTAGTGVPTTHRVVSVLPEGYETKGDANENVDAAVVPQASVLGRVVLVVPLLGHVLLWTNSGVGFLALVIVPLTLLALNELRDWSRRESGGEPAGETAESGSAEASDGTAPPAPERTVAVAAIDLKLAALAMAGLFAYAGWNVYREVAAVAAPNPVSVGALTGGLLGLLFAGWVTTAAWRRNRAAIPAGLASAPRTDGGESEGGDDA
jgi:signal peptidase